MTLKAARAQAVDALDDEQTIEGAVTALRANLKEAENGARHSGYKVEQAAHAVLRAAPELAGLFAEVVHLERELADKGSALMWLLQMGHLDSGAEPADAERGTAAVRKKQSRKTYL